MKREACMSGPLFFICLIRESKVLLLQGYCSMYLHVSDFLLPTIHDSMPDSVLGGNVLRIWFVSCIS